VVATVILADGQTIQLNKTIEVRAPIALLADFDAGAQDLSDMSNAVTVGQSVTFETHGKGQAIRLNGDVVTYRQSTDFFNNVEYTFLVDFKKDSGHEKEGGRLINFAGSLVAIIGANDISVAVTTDQGTTWLRTKNIG